MIALWLACAQDPEPPPVVAEPARYKAKTRVRQGDAVVVLPAVRDPQWAAARCNDGTPAGLRYRPGAEGSTTWVIKVAGGFFCEDDRVPCADRERRLTTGPPGTDGAAVNLSDVGLFSRDPEANPQFATAHHVQFEYCSSDLWLGTSSERQATPASPDGWYFSGRTVFAADVAALKGLGLDETTARILVVGHSAGGAGVVGNLSTLMAAFPTAAASGRLKVVLDGSWIPAVDSPLLPSADRWGPVQEACDAAARAEGRDPTTCIYGPNWWPHVASTGIDVLVQISAADTTQTRVFVPERTAEAAETWKKNAIASLAPLPWVFSREHAYHVVTFEKGFAEGPEPTFRDVLDAFWADEPARRVIEGAAP